MIDQSRKDPIVSKKLALPFALITSLFALWGFANAVTDPMVTAFKKVLELNNFQASLVQLAFYGGYFTMAIPASLFVRKYSYKLGVLIGLGLFATGALLFYPAAVTQEFTFFLMGLYILTFGLAFLETTANPYILAMGSSKTATQRLNLAQAFNPVGLIIGLLAAQQFVLKKLQSDNVDFAGLSDAAKASIREADLHAIRNPYMAIGLVVLILLVIIVFNKMPEKRDPTNRKKFWETLRMLVTDRKYLGGVFAQMFYVGAQIMCWTYIYHYAEVRKIPAEVAGNYQFTAFILFFFARFLFTYLMKYIKPEILLIYVSLMAAFLMLIVITSTGIIGLYALVGVSFMMSMMFPTIYGIALDGMPEGEAKIGAAGLVMAIVGGALMPTLQGLVLDLGGPGYQDISVMGISEINFSFLLPLLSFLLIATFTYSVKDKLSSS